MNHGRGWKKGRWQSAARARARIVNENDAAMKYDTKELRRDRHSVSSLTDHMVMTPKFRGDVLGGEVARRMEELIREKCQEMDVDIIRMSVCLDHVHMFFTYPPRLAPAAIANTLKGYTSTMLRKEFPILKDWCPGTLWSPGTFHGSVGHGWDVVEKYISSQFDYREVERLESMVQRVKADHTGAQTQARHGSE